MEIDGRTIHSEEEILTALQEEFDGKDFIQTSGGMLEYHSGEKHFYVDAEFVEQEKIKAAFISCFRGDGEYLRDLMNLDIQKSSQLGRSF